MAQGVRYPLRVLKTATQRGGTRRSEDQRSPTRALLFGLIITLAAVVVYSAYITVQISGLRKLQSEMVDRNRRDSLQLLRLQNDLNSVARRIRIDEGEQLAHRLSGSPRWRLRDGRAGNAFAETRPPNAVT